MQPVEIKKDIYWIGYVDYDHRDFHGYSRSPDGSTYNAYLIKDEKNALLDTVAPGCHGTLLCRMAQVLEPQKVLTLPVTVTAPAGTRGRAPLKFTVESGDGRVRKSVDSSFFGPI